ncbi:hypothetical protein SDRG_01866 [Saprolegnia diclina VS20]|uniref:Uncharacterized protein n=1 Tax=Saprolegnia diclina (strain VS20) TaxID=1156394 RepID=T0R1F6_SAPDV|nr:hypothetical protein SDRG_01866 [Saprolegnia diclina VS20]EQC40796.1 hypothetical protein SDRG_01866 [Saprolegnia diclina VS20]|eukprot:XP_008605640.1 hypothetical protein SDRG_01866 [Saprolegnia diclina VS20]
MASLGPKTALDEHRSGDDGRTTPRASSRTGKAPAAVGAKLHPAHQRLAPTKSSIPRPYFLNYQGQGAAAPPPEAGWHPTVQHNFRGIAHDSPLYARKPAVIAQTRAFFGDDESPPRATNDATLPPSSRALTTSDLSTTVDQAALASAVDDGDILLTSGPMLPRGRTLPPALNTSDLDSPMASSTASTASTGPRAPKTPSGTIGDDGLTASQKVRIGLSGLLLTSEAFRNSTGINTSGRSLRDASPGRTRALNLSSAPISPASSRTSSQGSSRSVRTEALVAKLIPTKNSVQGLIGYIKELQSSEASLRTHLDTIKTKAQEDLAASYGKVNNLESSMRVIENERLRNAMELERKAREIDALQEKIRALRKAMEGQIPSTMLSQLTPLGSPETGTAAFDGFTFEESPTHAKDPSSDGGPATPTAITLETSAPPSPSPPSPKAVLDAFAPTRPPAPFVMTSDAFAQDPPVVLSAQTSPRTPSEDVARALTSCLPRTQTSSPRLKAAPVAPTVEYPPAPILTLPSVAPLPRATPFVPPATSTTPPTVVSPHPAAQSPQSRSVARPPLHPSSTSPTNNTPQTSRSIAARSPPTSPSAGEGQTLSQLLTDFYKSHQPDKLKDVKHIVKTYTGKEHDLLQLLQVKYGARSIQKLAAGLAIVPLPRGATPLSTATNEWFPIRLLAAASAMGCLGLVWCGAASHLDCTSVTPVSPAYCARWTATTDAFWARADTDTAWDVLALLPAARETVAAVTSGVWGNSVDRSARAWRHVQSMDMPTMTTALQDGAQAFQALVTGSSTAQCTTKKTSLPETLVVPGGGTLHRASMDPVVFAVHASLNEVDALAVREMQWL